MFIVKVINSGTYKVRNEIETKRNETKQNQRKRNETKQMKMGADYEPNFTTKEMISIFQLCFFPIYM
jgi:hypothetical protein